MPLAVSKLRVLDESHKERACVRIGRICDGCLDVSYFARNVRGTVKIALESDRPRREAPASPTTLYRLTACRLHRVPVKGGVDDELRGNERSRYVSREKGAEE